MAKTATIRVPSLKVTVPLAAAALPGDLVPMDGPAGEPTFDIVLEGGSLTVRAKLNGKNYRKLIKQVARARGGEHRAGAPGRAEAAGLAGRPVPAGGGRVPGGGQGAPPGRAGRGAAGGRGLSRHLAEEPPVTDDRVVPVAGDRHDLAGPGVPALPGDRVGDDPLDQGRVARGVPAGRAGRVVSRGRVEAAHSPGESRASTAIRHRIRPGSFHPDSTRFGHLGCDG